MVARKLVLVIGVLGCLLACPGGVAASISDSLGHFVNRSLSLVVSGLVFPNIAGPFIERVALDSIQLPVPANSTSFTYSFNPELGSFERSSGSLGPVFLDRAETLGEGRFDLTFSYQFANLTDLNGDSFGQQLQFGFVHQFPDGTAAGGTFKGKEFSLKENVFSFNGTYGITNRWDVNLLVPMLYTSLDLNGVAVGAAVGESGGAPTPQQSVSFHNKGFGIGDILLRTKYRFYDDPDVVLLAGALTLRMPSGSAGNFQGLGDFTITPALIVSRPIGRNDIHMNLAMEFNTMEGARTRARYGIGATIQPLNRLALLLDLLGSSGLDDDKFSIPTGNVPPNCTIVNCVNYTATKTSVNAVVPRSDIVDLSTGVKFNPFATADIYLLAIIPLTQQGLRAAVIPAGGFEWTF